MEDVRWSAEQLEEYRLELSNRIRNLFWTVSGDYANNRDGLALKTVCSSLMERPEKNKILIVLSDGKPCDMSIQRPGTCQPKNYDGEGAVKDTAYEVRRARNQGIFVIGIFVGNEEELSVEKRIYGKDFAYICNISNFSRMVGTFLRRQIDME